jgi:hypothetical protein
MRRAGCFEVLYGLETISPRMQRRMSKYVEGMDAGRVLSLYRATAEAGLGLHVNLIAGFPGDTPRESAETVEFTVETLKDLDNATFTLNRFTLFPGTPVMKDSASFGVVPTIGPGDMPACYEYTVVPELQQDAAAVEHAIPALRARLLAGLGWDRLGAGPGAGAAVGLYFDSGHGALLKQQERNVFANPLRGVPEVSP